MERHDDFDALAGSRGDLRTGRDDDFGMACCDTSAHVSHSVEHCEVNRLLSKISEGQIQISVDCTRATFALSFIIALGAFVYHLIQDYNGRPFSLQWWEYAIIMAPYGGALCLRIQSQIPWMIKEMEDPNGRVEHHQTTK